uniref:DUF7753 domain-containing protein n=1 Tax=Panagrellus redivivus TaxID=6233 RepID=A0A7E4VPI5_PANRE
MPRCLCIVVVVALLTLLDAIDPLQCDVFDPACRARIQAAGNGHSVRHRAQNKCQYQDIWLIPGRADASCTRPDAKRLVDIDPRQVHIKPAVVKFPGCFTVEIRNVRVHDSSEVLSNSFFAKSEYQWLNVKEFSDVKCQNATNNGCGGYGNNCYYCDICESLRAIDKNGDSEGFSEQFRGLNCPRKAGYYTFRKEFCFNDWTAFDADGDCQMDFLQSDKSDYKGALQSLQQIGYGTVVAKIRMAYNATNAINNKRSTKEAQIEATVMRELEERRRNWDINRGQFEKFQSWYIEYRKNIWHREEYLPWLLYENEISCLRVTFDVCERVPRRKPYGGAGYTCD